MSLIVFYHEGLVEPEDLKALPAVKVPVFGDPHTCVMVVNGREVPVPDLPENLRAFLVAVERT